MERNFHCWNYPYAKVNKRIVEVVRWLLIRFIAVKKQKWKILKRFSYYFKTLLDRKKTFNWRNDPYSKAYKRPKRVQGVCDPLLDLLHCCKDIYIYKKKTGHFLPGEQIILFSALIFVIFFCYLFSPSQIIIALC